MKEATILDFIKSKVSGHEFRQELTDRLNSNINLPFINEKTEGTIIYALMGEVCDLINEKLDDI